MKEKISELNWFEKEKKYFIQTPNYNNYDTKINKKILFNDRAPVYIGARFS